MASGSKVRSASNGSASRWRPPAGAEPPLPTDAPPATGRLRVRAVPLLASLGVVLSLYLTWVHYGGALALCTGAGGCEEVQASRFASVAGVPVALLGLALYLGLLALGLWRARAGDAAPPTVALAVFGLALSGVLYSVYLTYLELFVIRAICPWCVTSAALLALLLALATLDVRDLVRGA